MGTLDPTSRIGAVRRTAVGGGGGGPPVLTVGDDRRGRPDRRDEVDLSEPSDALRKLARERILSATRRRLAGSGPVRPTVRPVEIAFAGARDLDAYVGQIRARQALMLASAGVQRGPAELARVIHDAALEGLAMTLEVLHDVGRLDEHAWRAVVAIHHAMLAHAK